MALVRVTVQLRDSLPAEILLYVTSRSKLLDVLGGMGLEVEDDLEVRARVAGTDGMLIWCDEKIGEVDGVSQYTVAGTLHLRPQPPSTVVPILLQHIAMRRIPQFTRQLHGLDSVSYWAARREMIRWLYVQDCVFLIRNRESTFCLVSDATSVTENSSALHITAATATTAYDCML